mmetsp:Transcript_21099/g.48707  ORF Transcript_21099/g.48707 Transcript_21099/m.48707 type:complete len:383 (-) Transcript_21099:618-1766(-)
METSSSTLVNVAEDAELRLVKLLAESAPKHLLSPSFSADCERSIVHADASGLMKLIVHDAGAIGALLVLQPADEAVSAFSLLAALLDRVRADRPEEEAGLAASLAESVVKTKVDGTNESDLSRRRIALLAALYNLRSQGTEKCGLLETMIRLASAYHPSMLLEGNPLGNLLMEESSTTRFTNLEPPLPRLATLVETWNVPPKHRRSLFQAVADGITDSVSRKQRFKLLLVETYADAGDTGEEGLRAAKDAAVGAIQDPVSLFMQQRTMLAMPAIQALANKPGETPFPLRNTSLCCGNRMYFAFFRDKSLVWSTNRLPGRQVGGLPYVHQGQRGRRCSAGSVGFITRCLCPVYADSEHVLVGCRARGNSLHKHCANPAIAVGR